MTFPPLSQNIYEAACVLFSFHADVNNPIFLIASVIKKHIFAIQKFLLQYTFLLNLSFLCYRIDLHLFEYQ